MPTRFYLEAPVSAVHPNAPVIPDAWDTGWNKTSGAPSAPCGTTKRGTTLTGFSNAASGTSGHFTAIARFISPPLAAQTVGTGTLNGQMRCTEFATTDNFTLAMAAKIVDRDGADVGVLRAADASDNTAATPPEWATSATNRQFQNVAEATALGMTDVSCSDGDYLVLEVGFRQASTSTNPGTVNVGSASATDLPEDNTDTGVKNPWIEFTEDLVFSLQPYFFGSSAPNPADNGAANEPATLALVPPVGMQAGDLVVMIGQLQVAATGQITVSEAGGQSWSAIAEQTGNDLTLARAWCIFDGTWDADPSLAFAAQSGTQPATAILHVFRAATGFHWQVDTPFAGATEASASPVVISGITPNRPNNFTLAVWAVPNVSTWGATSSTNWAPIGIVQARNTAGTDQSMCFAYQPQLTAGATGDVSRAPSTAAAGISFTEAFVAERPRYNPPVRVSQAVNRAGTY